MSCQPPDRVPFLRASSPSIVTQFRLDERDTTVATSRLRHTIVLPNSCALAQHRDVNLGDGALKRVALQCRAEENDTAVAKAGLQHTPLSCHTAAQ